MESEVLRALRNVPNKKKILKFHLELDFNNSQEIKIGKVLG